jgi:chorismate mutase/prephenate dehydratase
VEHRPGTLADAMVIFKRNKLNLTWIESFPLPGPERGYLFFVEMEAHESDARFRRAMATLGKKALRLEILGSFPATAAVD